MPPHKAPKNLKERYQSQTHAANQFQQWADRLRALPPSTRVAWSFKLAMFDPADGVSTVAVESKGVA